MLFRAVLRLLPSHVRSRLRDEMLAVYDARLAEAHGARARLGVWLSEMVGVLGAARRLRPVRPGGGRGWTWLEAIGRDAGFAFRTMARRPGAALLAVLTCGLGIGSATAMFGIVNGVLLRPLPFPEPDRVVSIYPTLEEWRRIPNLRANWDRGSFAQPELIEFSARQTSFSQVAFVSIWTRYLTGRGPATPVRTGMTTPELFALAGVRAVRGRLLLESDRQPAAGRVAVITHAFWQGRLGGVPDVIGTTLTLNDAAATVVGVLPPQFRLTGQDADIWLAVSSIADERERDDHNFRAIGRLAPGVTLARAEQETARLLRAISEAHDDLTHGANLEPRLADLTRVVRAPLLLLLGGALVLLVVACANFAALLLGTGLDRTTELAVRSALGAGRRRIIRLLLAESLLLALIGGAVGVVLAGILTRGLVLLAPPGLPRIDEVAVDARAIGVALGLALLAGIVFGSVPALALGTGDVGSRLRASRSATPLRQRLHALLVVAQVALATVLLLGAGLLGRTLLHLDRTDPGFAPDSLLAIAVAVPAYRFFGDEGAFLRAEYAAYTDGVRAALEEVPGVREVAVTSIVPFGGSRANNDIEPEGYRPSPGERLVAERAFVSGNYLEVIGARLVEGRLLAPADDRRDAAPVMVISRRLARRVWPDGSAIGRTIAFRAGQFTVVGVIEDVRDWTLGADDRLRFYVPLKAAGQSGDQFVLRIAGDGGAVASAVRDRLAAFDADLSVTRIEPLDALIHASLAEQRYRARLLVCFAGLALFFVVSGIHGAMNRRVALRRHEIGVRLALGARQAGVLGSIVRESVALAGAGILIGTLVAVSGSGLIRGWLSGVTPTDPVTYAGIALLLAMTAALAALAPSLRAARTDPMTTLRGD